MISVSTKVYFCNYHQKVTRTKVFSKQNSKVLIGIHLKSRFHNPKGLENIEPCGAIVKYHPCTRHARGSPCLYYSEVKKCDRPPLACEMPEYDKWYKDVLKGKMKCFYPNRIPLLENVGVSMFLFHVHHHAIVGEAKIIESTVENGRHLYCFDEFLSYTHPVQLELLETDPRLRRIGRRGRWLSVYISEETIEEIRNFSKLSERKRKELGKDLKQIIEELKKRPPYKRARPTWEFYMANESEKLKKHKKLNEQVLAEAQKYFSQSVHKKLSIGRSLDEMFYASLYLAFRMLRIPKLLKDITEISGIDPVKLGKMYRLFVKEFNLMIPPLDPEQLIRSRAGRLDISRKTIKRAVSVIQEARKRSIIRGKSPSSIAAVATVFACQKEGEERKQKQIAETFGVSAVTIRNLSRKLEAW